MVKNPSANAGDMGSIPESGRSPGEGNGNSHQYSCLGNPTDSGDWWATVYGVTRVGHNSAPKITTIVCFESPAAEKVMKSTVLCDV